MLSSTTNPFTLFANGDYRRIWLCGLLAGVARWLEFTALGIFAYEITQSPPLVALLALVRMSPFIVLGLILGALTDVIDRKRWLIVLTAILMCLSAAMAVAARMELATYEVVLAAAVATGIYWVADMPLRRRLMMEAIDPQLLTSGAAFDNITNHATRAIGPIAGGIAYQFLGPEGIFAFSGLLYMACLALLVGVSKGREADNAPSERTSFRQFLPPRVLLLNPRFLIILGITVVYNVWCFPLVAMIPVLAERDLSLPPAAVGVLSASEGLGGMIAALAIGIFASNRWLLGLYFWGPFVYLLLLVVLVASLNLTTSAVVFIAAGAAAACFSAAQYTLVYLSAPADMRGRATGILSIFIGTSAIGLYNTGYLFGAYSSSVALGIMAAEGLAVVVVLGVLLLVVTNRRLTD